MASLATIPAAEVNVLEETPQVEEGNTGGDSGGSVEPSAATKREREETKHLLGIFPEEVWCLILDNVVEAQGQENIANSSPYFRHLLGSKRVEYLFPKVFRILGQRTEISREVKRDNFWYDCGEWERYVDNFNQHQSLRLVCKSWSDGVLEYYQSHPSHLDPDVLQETDNESGVRKVGGRNPFWFTIENRERLNALRNHFKASHGSGPHSRNPFLSRFVAFQDSEDARYQNGVRVWEGRSRDPQSFWNDISSLLFHFGHHVWYCQINVEDRFPSRVDYYNQLKEWLALMPNLKTLNLVYVRQTDPFPEERVNDVESHMAPTAEDLHNLEQNAVWNHLPSLNSLHLLRTRGLPTPIFNEILRRNSHMVMLDTSPFNFQRNHQGYDIYSCPLPNLNFLSMQFAATADTLELGQLQSPLTTLRLGYLGSTFPYQDWPQIFKLISDKWSDALTELSLSFLPPENQDDPQSFLEIYQNLALNLGCLKRLKLNLFCCFPIDFVLSVKDTLEDLHVHFKVKTVAGRSTPLASYLEENGAALRKLELMDGDLEDSNIWGMLGKLRTLTFDECNLHVSSLGSYSKYRYACIGSRRICGSGSKEDGSEISVRVLAYSKRGGTCVRPDTIQFDDIKDDS